MSDQAEAAARAIAASRPEFRPRVGLILGSGLGRIAERIEDATAISYGGLPGFPVPTVEGHAGRLVLGRLAGVPVACLQGRVHLYEGAAPSAIGALVRPLKLIGRRARRRPRGCGPSAAVRVSRFEGCDRPWRSSRTWRR